MEEDRPASRSGAIFGLGLEHRDRQPLGAEREGSRHPHRPGPDDDHRV